MSNFIGMVFATLKENGIDTKDMSTDEAIKKYNELNPKAEKETTKEFGIDNAKDFLNDLKEIDEDLDLSVDDLMEALAEIKAMNVKSKEAKQVKIEEKKEEVFKEDDGNWKGKEYLLDEYNTDYRTKDLVGDDIFDTTKTGMSYYDDFLNPEGKRYMETQKGLTGNIEYITPREYFEKTAQIFNSDVDTQIEGIGEEKSKINMLKSVLKDKKKTFPLPYLNFASNKQEGRHRMYVAGELYGWDKKFPTLIVTDY